MTIQPAGDCALVAAFTNEISPQTNAQVMRLCAALKSNPVKGVLDCIPTFRSALITYDPLLITYAKLEKKLRNLAAAKTDTAAAPSRVFHIPVCYGGTYGEDLPDVAAHTGLSAQEVIHLHSAQPYLIYMLGFLPGFPYLGGLDPRLFTPRLSSPRTAIPAGAVGIGGEQTGIYPLPSPGGWRLIGRTPVKPYDPTRADPILYNAGDRIQFYPVTQEEYLAIEQAVETNTYTCRVEPYTAPSQEKGGA